MGFNSGPFDSGPFNDTGGSGAASAIPTQYRPAVARLPGQPDAAYALAVRATTAAASPRPDPTRALVTPL
jgi:hypothetical protein